jgi:hypothetical protein
VGDSHNGIAQMFKIMEFARMMVGIKGVATLSTGYLNALEYAKARVQGADLTQMTDKTAPRIPIIGHPDVRRSLMTQKAYAEGLRALYLYTAAHLDDVAAQLVSGADAAMAARVSGLLLPVVKAAGSERSYQYLTESLQTLGGSGYLADYPIEQYIRDAKIDSLYEGTTAIQAQDLVFRKIIRDQRGGLDHVLAQIRTYIDGGAGHPSLRAGTALLAAALADIDAIVATFTDLLIRSSSEPRTVYRIGLQSVPFLLGLADLLIGWLLLRQADIALRTLDQQPGARDEAFYRGKVMAAKFFAANVLPRLTALRHTVENDDLTVMDLDEAAF